MKSKGKVIARVVSIVLVVLMIAGLMSAAFTAFAAVPPEPTVLPKQDIYFRDKRITVYNNYIVPKNGFLRVEKGVTLTIEGHLQVLGTLKNEGTIIVTGVTRQDGQSDEVFEPGTLSNRGTIENKGKISANGGMIYNYARATFDNIGTLELINKFLPDTSVFHNMYRPRGEYHERGTVNNTGTILISNTVGTGLYNHKGAVINNQEGEILLTDTGTYRGEITGKQPEKQSA